MHFNLIFQHFKKTGKKTHIGFCCYQISKYFQLGTKKKINNSKQKNILQINY